MGKYLRFGGLAILLYILFLLATIPADFVVRQVAGQLQGVTLIGPSGTLWRGELQSVVIKNRQVSNLTINNVKWSFSFLGLFTGKTAISLELNDESINGTATIGRTFSGKIVGHDVYLKMPLELMNPLMRKSRVQTKGTLNTQLDNLAWNGEWLDALEGKLLVSQLNVNASMMRINTDLGNYTIDLSLDDSQKMIAQVNGVKDKLGLAGNLSLDTQRKLSVDLTAKSPLPPEFAAAQAFLKKEGDRFKLTQTLSL
ncbi:MAG: type II secretion system protein N [Pseudomonadota bacterium]